MGDLNVKREDLPAGSGYKALPTGWYPCVIAKVEWRKTKSGQGRYLQLELKVIETHYTGRLIWDRLNLEHPNPEAVAFSRSTLADIMLALDLEELTDSSQLVGKQIEVRAVYREPSGRYDETNDVRGYRAFGQQQGKAKREPQSYDNIPF